MPALNQKMHTHAASPSPAGCSTLALLRFVMQARDSLLRRIPCDIIGRVFKENDEYLQQHPRSRELLLQLQDEMRNADSVQVRPIECFGGPQKESSAGASEAACERGAPGGLPCGFCRECETRDIKMWNDVLLKDVLKGGVALSKIPWILSEVYCYRCRC